MTSTKRPADSPSAGGQEPTAKKPRVGGFRVPAPANLPDGPWRRKAVKIKHELIVKSKIKKEYAKVKKHQLEQQQPAKGKDIFPNKAENEEGEDEDEHDGDNTQDGRVEGEQAEEEAGQKRVDGRRGEPQPEPEIHPDRVRMLDGEDEQQQDEDVNGFRTRPDAEHARNRDRRRQQRKPGYFEKELKEAERKKAEAEARAKERERREKEREKAIKERERHRRIMAKARSGGRDGKRKLGKESIVMLDRVKRLVGQK
ncbi:hypothetical protein NKR19_g6889 [Coniochaeta hoffmannii]|uniref:rRNA-processing protein FYV7 n=1 Tax=Coniochaeta hoffmannii TaxID=91930 RepID=A0AA38RNZ4_9PEZI|nr:hypothetical protein NKR19_g6889 [Coniochaeta hoffmannii]